MRRHRKNNVKSRWFLVAVVALAAMSATAAQQAATDTATPASAGAPVAVKGKMLVSSNGSRLGVIYRVGPDGSAQIIIDGKLVTVPASTLSAADGKVVTSLSKSEILALP